MMKNMRYSISLSVLLVITLLSLSGCVPPTEPDTPRRKIIEPSATFLRTFDKSIYEMAYDVQETEDEGFLLTGKIWSVSTASVNLLLLRADKDGRELWSRSFGGIYEDHGYALALTSDGGSIVAGTTESFSNGMHNVWVIKTAPDGQKQWSKSFGGNGVDGAWDVKQCRDGSFIVCGYTEVQGSGDLSAWIIRLDASGNEDWNFLYGNSEHDVATSIEECEDGGFIVGGYTLIGELSLSSMWLFKISDSGELQWEKTYQGEMNRTSMQLIIDSDSGYVLVGNANPPSTQSSEIVILGTDGSGWPRWQKVLHSNSFGTSLTSCQDGGFIVAGYSDPFGRDGSDILLTKLGAEGNVEWKRSFGGSRMDRAFSVRQARDGGYIIVGTSTSYGDGNEDIILIRTDANGNIES